MRWRYKFLISIFLLGVFICGWYLLWLSPKYTVPILMYHRFGYEKSSLFVSPENFLRQIRYLKNKGYKVISLDELVRVIKEDRPFPSKAVVITIDDGYRDSYLYAYPVLKKYKIPAIVFVVAGSIGKKDFLTWDQIKEMLNHGIDFGAHTINEVYLPSIRNKKTLWEEIAGSKKLLEEKLKTEILYFSYPTGGFTEEIKYLVKKAGYKAACTTNRGASLLNKDLYELKRIKITNSDTNKLFSFWAKLSGYYNLFRSKKRGD